MTGGLCNIETDVWKTSVRGKVLVSKNRSLVSYHLD